MQIFRRCLVTWFPRSSLVLVVLFWLAFSLGGADAAGGLSGLGSTATDQMNAFKGAFVPLLVAGAALSVLCFIAWIVIQIIVKSDSD